MASTVNAGGQRKRRHCHWIVMPIADVLSTHVKPRADQSAFAAATSRFPPGDNAKPLPSGYVTDSGRRSSARSTSTPTSRISAIVRA